MGKKSALRAPFSRTRYRLIHAHVSRKSVSASACDFARKPVANWQRVSTRQLFPQVAATPHSAPQGRSRKPGCMSGKYDSALLGSGARHLRGIFIRARNPGSEPCLAPQVSHSGGQAGHFAEGAWLQPHFPHTLGCFDIFYGRLILYERERRISNSTKKLGALV